MTVAAEVAQLAALIETVTGNVIPPGHHAFLEATARRRAGARGVATVAEYVRALARGDLQDEWRALAPAVTIKESYFFRTPAHFTALGASVIGPLLEARSATRSLRVWSAGCARGEEPGTLAIVLAEDPRLAGWDWRIVATDVDEDALAATRLGLYGDRAVGQVPADMLCRHFHQTAGGWELSPTLRRRIETRPFNLIREPFEAPGAPFDLVFLRNVLIYFRPESQRRVVAAIAGAMAPDGVLFVGPAETLWQLSEAFVPADLGDCFCYRLRGPDAPLPPRPNSDDLPAVRPIPPPRVRVASPPARPRPSPAGAPPAVTAPSVAPGDHVATVSEALRDSRLDDARRLLDAALRDDPGDPLVHALEGIFHDVGRHPGLSIAAYRAALFLDPGLYQVRLLLADALRRSGHQGRAIHEYREVLASLAGRTSRDAAVLAGLPVPNREQAEAAARRALQALTSGGPPQP